MDSGKLRMSDKPGALAALTDAVRAKNIEMLLSQCAPELGAAATGPAQGGAAPPSEAPEPEVHQLELLIGGEVAFSRSLNRVGGRQQGGRAPAWLSYTLGLRKIDGRWKIVHEHAAIPGEAERAKAS